MLWWLIALTVVVLYLLAKVAALLSWLSKYYDAVNQHFIDCGCPAGETWPPPKPPDFP